ncbi:MAG: hypothetical protein Q9194_003601 [Teloschistes cf. exilis]
MDRKVSAPTAKSPGAGNEAMCDTDIEKRVLRKCDLHVLPILYTLYMLSYLDRINIGNARIEGLEKDLGMSGNDYNIAVQVLFIPYILLEVPSNIMLKRVAPSTWLSFIMFIWVIAKWLIVDWPEQAQFLNSDERVVLLQRLEEDEGFAKMNTLNRKSFLRTLSDWKIWVGGLMYLGTTTSTYSVSYYLPTVLKEFGYTSSAAQVQTIPIYAAGLLVAFLTAWSSDRLRHRYGFVILGAVTNAVGYMFLLAQSHVSVNVRYMALYLVECGLWIGSPVEIVWITSNLGGHYKRALGSAIATASGNLSGFIASNVFITSQAPRYPAGYGVALGMTVFAALAAAVLFLGLRRENRRRDRGGRDYRLQSGKDELENMGDDHPGFRYGL